MQGNNQQPDFRFHLDTPEAKRLQGDEYYLAGWFLPLLDEHAKLILEIDGRDQDIEGGFPRPDVARHFPRAEARHCGFVVRFPAPKFHRVVHVKVRSRTGDVNVASVVQVPAYPLWNTPGTQPLAASYTEWLESTEPTLFWPAAEIPSRLSKLSYLPTVDVLLGLNFADAYFVEASLRSVLEQHYQKWTVTVLDFRSADLRTRAFLEKVAAEDSRIRLSPGDYRVFSEAFHSAIGNTTAEFVTVLEPPDELHRFALLEVVNHLNEAGHVDLLYTDEDRIDPYGRRSFPNFKPDFDWEIFCSFNYLSRLTVLRAALAKRLLRNAALIPETDAAAYEWDFLLSAAEETGSANIGHIEKVLYHQRIFGEKPEEDRHGGARERKMMMRVASAHNHRHGFNAIVEPGLLFPLIRTTPLFAHAAKTAVITRCEDGMFQQSTLALNLNEETARVYELVSCLLYRDDPKFGRQLIRSLEEIEDEVIVFVNGPLETVSQRFCEELTAQARRSDCGIVSGISLNTDLRIVSSGFVWNDAGELSDPYAGTPFSDLTRFAHLNTVRSVEAVSSHFFAVSKAAIAEVGGVGSISGTDMPGLVARLTNRAHSQSRRVLVTPFAVATFENPATLVPEGLCECRQRSPLKSNRNLAAFESIPATLRIADGPAAET